MRILATGTKVLRWASNGRGFGGWHAGDGVGHRLDFGRFWPVEDRAPVRRRQRGHARRRDDGRRSVLRGGRSGTGRHRRLSRMSGVRGEPRRARQEERCRIVSRSRRFAVYWTNVATGDALSDARVQGSGVRDPGPNVGKQRPCRKPALKRDVTLICTISRSSPSRRTSPTGSGPCCRRCSTHIGDISADVVVVDNDSHDGTQSSSRTSFPRRARCGRPTTASVTRTTAR